MRKDFEKVVDAFQVFATEAAGILNIQNDTDCDRAEALLDHLFEMAGDESHLNPLIDLVADAITRYEDQNPEVVAFEREAAALDTGISALRLLMDQHRLKAKDLKEEIGSPALISLILSGDRNLTVTHIEKLSARFGVDPGMFFR